MDEKLTVNIPIEFVGQAPAEKPASHHQGS